MGLNDRHYVRDVPLERGTRARGGIAAMGMWSVNTWIIAICVAVFVVDGFLPPRDVTTGRVELNNPDTPLSMLKAVQVPHPRSDAIVYDPLVEKSTGRQVGWAEAMQMK